MLRLIARNVLSVLMGVDILNDAGRGNLKVQLKPNLVTILCSY